MLPPRLFAEPIFLRCLLITFGNSLTTFAITLLLPLHFQLAHGDSAEASGLLLTPFLLSFVVLSYYGGQMSRKLGRTRLLMVAALASCATGALLLASIGAGTPAWLTVAWSLLAGAGIGLVQPNITVTLQNAADPRDVGVATGCMLLVRSIGGAFGATMAGAIVAWGLSGDAAAAVLQGRAAALAAVTGAARTDLLRAIDSGFHMAFAVCGAICLVTLAIAFTMRDVALRSR
jgi:MFS family permease